MLRAKKRDVEGLVEAEFLLINPSIVVLYLSIPSRFVIDGLHQPSRDGLAEVSSM